MECAFLSRGGFFKKYLESREAACRGFISLSCRGGEMNEGKRKEFRKAHGASPPGNKLPNGQSLAL
jgi:hypothetical protein